jgi:hypothetical protein
MSRVGDILALAWLNRQDGGVAYVDTFPVPVDFDDLERRGFLQRVPSSEVGGRDAYVITAAGKAFQQGD